MFIDVCILDYFLPSPSFSPPNNHHPCFSSYFVTLPFIPSHPEHHTPPTHLLPHHHRIFSLYAACEYGNYGVNCKFSCRCGGNDCNTITGACFCNPGKTGEDCAEGEDSCERMPHPITPTHTPNYILTCTLLLFFLCLFSSGGT